MPHKLLRAGFHLQNLIAYIPAQKYKNWPKERQNLTKQGYPAFTTGNREVAVKPGMVWDFRILGSTCMVFYGDYGDEESIQTALEHAKDFHEKSQMNGATPIRIPVVVMNPDNIMWLQGDDDYYNTSSSAQQQPPPFTCPSSTNDNNGTGNRTGTRIGNGSGNGNGDDAVSSSGSSTNNVFNISHNIITAVLLSVAYIIASVH